MGDNRAEIKIEFYIYGEDYKTDMSINYSPESGDGWVDSRVIEFFRGSYDKAYALYQERLYESEREARAEQHERAERAEFERLKKKYENLP